MPICTPAQQALLPLLHPSVGTAPAGVSSGHTEPGRFPSICPCPAAAHPHGNSRPWAAQASWETPSASRCTKNCRHRGGLGLVVAAEGHHGPSVVPHPAPEVGVGSWGALTQHK